MIVATSTATTTAVKIKTLNSEIDRLSIKYNLSSSTARAIIKCEGGAYGVVRDNVNLDKNGIPWSIDHFDFQINDYYHESTMNKMGLSIHDRWDTLEYGFYLMKKQGLKPWKASIACWSKKI